MYFLSAAETAKKLLQNNSDSDEESPAVAPTFKRQSQELQNATSKKSRWDEDSDEEARHDEVKVPAVVYKVSSSLIFFPTPFLPFFDFLPQLLSKITILLMFPPPPLGILAATLLKHTWLSGYNV